MSNKQKLKKELRLLDVFAIATGTTLSAGFFLLPGIAAQEAGAGLVLAYIIAAIPLIPAMFSIIELSTAMPRAGGVYYFLDRTLGPFFGTIGGIGTWLSLILKVAFALIGMGAYLTIFFDDLPIIPIAIGIALLLGLINLKGAGAGSKVQVLLVSGLLLILVSFLGGGISSMQVSNITKIFDTDFDSLIATAGLVYISYIGVTKVASLSEEVKDPEKNLPLGIFLALGTALVVYVLGTTVMVTMVPIEELAGALTPAALAAEKFAGDWGVYAISLAALFSFISVANAGTLSASRYPLAMSRDHLMPPLFRKLDKDGSPFVAVIITVLSIIAILLLFDPTKIAKLASAFQLLMFALVCLAVIVMRESKIESYDPGYKTPFYPYVQILGILSAFLLIFRMGWLPILFTSLLIFAGVLWFNFYAAKRITRVGAVFHVFERLGRSKNAGLDRELRGILKEKGLREKDPFDDIVLNSHVIDISGKTDFEEVCMTASMWISGFVNHPPEEINKEFLEGTRIGATPVTHGVALPHMRIEGLEQAKMVLVRSVEGIKITFTNPLTDFEECQIINAIFFLVSPENQPTQHLRILARIAGRVDEETFAADWEAAAGEFEIKHTLLQHDNWLTLNIGKEQTSSELIGKKLKEIEFPSSCLVATINRRDSSIIPKGNTVLMENDALTIIGDVKGIAHIQKKYN